MSDKTSYANVYSRQYVGNTEAAAYVIFDGSESINAGIFASRFNIDILKINLNLYSLLSIINGVWDVVNDTFIGQIVDKTRTRFGKFRPYLIAFAVPSLLLGVLQWLMPYFVNTDNEYDLTKFFMFLAIQVSGEAIGTFRSIAKTGLLAALTPNPAERVKLLSMAKFISCQFDQFPNIILGVVYDAMNNGLIKISSRKAFYASIGISTAVISTSMALFFFAKAKERVTQAEKIPNIVEGFKTIISSRPVFLLMLNDLLNALKFSTSNTNYYIDVLGFSSFGKLVETPSLPLFEISYSWIGWTRRKFSTRALWLMSTNIDNVTNLLTFAFGCIGGRGRQGWYRSWKKMFLVMASLDMVRKSVWGTRNVIPQEITYEAIDYCEWKNGYRSEGIIMVTKGLMSKIISNLTSGLQHSIMSSIGYSLGRGFGQQDDATKFNLFATSFLLPGVTGALSIIPKLLYNLGPAEKEVMYRELKERRQRQEELRKQVDGRPQAGADAGAM
ncbi:MAG TPA: MFS transporter [Clostridiales bacterium]|nr:MAG: Inner membrane symporter YicJ [Firmicutes bacterium ADurb.Bin262]HOU09142.1 MFS transporter [Clostridiales bacterium]HQK73869.1 MFS transporter [Clostridiales bacterium]